jgi:hypothetical protein
VYTALTYESSNVLEQLRFHRLNLLLKFQQLYFLLFQWLPLFIANFECKFSKIKQEMFTGIIETLGTIQEIKEKNNLHITVESSIKWTSNRPKCCTMESALLLLT